MLITSNFNIFSESREKAGKVGERVCSIPLGKDHFASRLKILLVEDNLLVQKVHLTMLQAFGHDTTIAKNGREALECAATNKYDIIFMDIGLPDINGINIAKRIRGNSLCESCKCPIVALTAYVEEELHDDCIKAGMNLVENKPVSSTRLQQICTTICF